MRSRLLSECLEPVDTPEGRKRVADFLDTLPFPHFEPHPDQTEILVRVDADGSRTTGRFRGHEFQPSCVGERDVEIPGLRVIRV